MDTANVLLRNWRILLAVPLALALLVGLWKFSKPRMYEASTSFVPQAQQSTAGGRAAALAEQFGVSLASERPTQSPQFYVSLLRSLTLLRDVVESEYEIRTPEGEARSATLIELYELEGEAAAVPPWRRAVSELRKNISTSVDRETGVIRLSVTAPQADLAEQITWRSLELLNEFNLEVRQTRAQEEGRFISERLGDAQADLLEAERELQDFLRQNRDLGNSPELRFEHDRLQRQVAMRQDVYTSLLMSWEQARIDAVRDTPLLTVIDHPEGTAEPQGRGTLLRAILAFLFGLVLAVFIAFLREFGRRSRMSESTRYQEMTRLARQTWEEIRHPRQWLPRSGR